ncbi:MAG: ABC transporter ATP-binding protein [Planctomycetaceae bacterium]
MADPIVSLSGVDKIYDRRGQSVRVLEKLDVEVERGDFIALMGPSGSGKTTLLNLVGGLDVPSAGRVTVLGEEISALGARALAAWRARHIGFIFQFYHLIPVLTAAQNVELPLLLTRLGRRERRRRAALALEIVGLADRAGHRPGELSGGQQQRVAIARAVVSDPELLLADEPTGDLDARSAHEILDLMKALNAEHGKTILMVTHDPRAAAAARRVLHLDKGVLEEGVRVS